MSDFSRIEEIFCTALQKPKGAEREAYLDEACRGAPEFLRAVEKLLAAHDQAGSFLDAPPSELMPTVDLSDVAMDAKADLIGTRVGPYRLLEQIGEGGMGIVYMADQQEPIRRRVALKIIKPGLDTRQVIARFEAERRALALMDHANIARVLDGGATDSGRPYFVMELVRGVPITEYCDSNNLPVHERLELFTQVCMAVQHAHQKGIIHRDIKPSNVLVTMNDGQPVPKVIDFGVAKAINQQLIDSTLFTNFAQMIGTPLYMSPEQAEMSSLDVDTRTDIYSLGVLLYELLTGTTPFDRQLLREAAYDEVRRIIREESPLLPSVRLSTLGQSRTTVAAHRQADPHRLSQLLQGDLDWIVMKSLEKDRTRRYETAIGLAADVKRHLSNLPVEACPPSTLYRLRKFTRRNRAAIATVATIASALVLGTVLSSWQAVRATRAERRADEQAVQALASERTALAEKQRADAKSVEAESRAAEAIQERQRAEKAFEQARLAVDQSFTTISEDDLLDTPGMQPLRKKLLEQALGYYDKFLQDHADDRDVQTELASTYSRVGSIRETLGEIAQADVSFRRELQIREKLADANPGVAEYQNDLAVCHTRLSGVQRDAGQNDASEASSKRAIEIYENLAPEHRADLIYQGNLAVNYGNLANLQSETGRRPEAEASYRKAIEIGEQLVKQDPHFPTYRSNLANNYNNLSNVQIESGLAVEAEESCRKAIAIGQELTSADVASDSDEAKLAHAYENLASVQRMTGHLSDANESLQKSIQIEETLARENPAVPRLQIDLANGYLRVADLRRATGANPDAEAKYHGAIEIAETIVREYPMVPAYQNLLVRIYTSFADLLSDTGRTTEAEASFRRAIEIGEPLAKGNPAVTTYQSALADAYLDFSILQDRAGRKSEAVATCQKAIDIQARLAADNPSVPGYRGRLAIGYRDLAVVHSAAGRKSEAEALYLRAIDIEKKLVNECPDTVGYKGALAHSYGNLGALLSGIGRKPEAETWFHNAIDIQETLVKSQPAIINHKIQLANCYHTLAGLESASGRMSEAEAHYQRAFILREAIVNAAPNDAHAKYVLANSYILRANLQSASEHTSDTLTLYRRANDLLEQLLEVDPANEQWSLLADWARIGAMKLWAFERVGNQEEVERFCAAVKKFNRAETVRNVVLGATCYRLGQYDEAEQALKQALALANVFTRFQANDRTAAARRQIVATELLMAMNEHEKGNLEQAKEKLAKAMNSLSNLRGEPARQDVINPHQTIQVDLKALANEAVSLIDGVEQNKAKSPKAVSPEENLATP